MRISPNAPLWNRNRPRLAVFARSRGELRRRNNRGTENPASRGAKRAGRILAIACARVLAGVSRRPAMRGRGSASVSLPGALSVLHQHRKGCSVRDLKLLIHIVTGNFGRPFWDGGAPPGGFFRTTLAPQAPHPKPPGPQ